MACHRAIERRHVEQIANCQQQEACPLEHEREEDDISQNPFQIGVGICSECFRKQQADVAGFDAHLSGT